MSVYNTINVKDLPQLEEIIEGNFIIIENQFGSNILNFKDFVIGPNNASFYNSIVLLSAYAVSSVLTLSSSILTLSATDQANFQFLNSRINTISSFENYVKSTSALETNIQVLCSRINATSAFYFQSQPGSVTINVGEFFTFYNFNAPSSAFDIADINVVPTNQPAASAASWVQSITSRRNTGTFPSSAAFVNTVIIGAPNFLTNTAIYRVKAFKNFNL